MDISILERTITEIAVPGKGILAADESSGTIKKRFQTINLESTEENRRAYRDMLFSTPNLNEFISGVILFEETLYQKAANQKPFPSFLTELGIVPGIKVDKGTINLSNFNGDKVTEGLDGLGNRLLEYKNQGARFAKWRAVITITPNNPSNIAIKTNSELLARYAAICQENNIVPIVEPEVLMDGDHNIERCAEVTLTTLHSVFHALHRHKVILEGMILKPNMVISGLACPSQATSEMIAAATLKVFRETIPAAVPTINFLSGGQTSETATANLQAINASSMVRPWNMSFSYGRALQDHALKTWNGKTENVNQAQKELYKRAKLNGLAALGKYNSQMEK